MRLQDLLRPGDVLCGFAAQDKWAAIERMMEHLRKQGRVPEDQYETILEAVLAREQSMSTGMERGVAIPHAAVEGLEQIVGCLAIAPEGLNFESIDASPTRFCVLLLIPRKEKLLHIKTLAEVAKVLCMESVRAGLLTASNGEEAWHALEEAAA